MKICVVRLSALGDVCLCLALVRQLQMQWPNAEMSWVISENFYPLVAHLKKIEFIVIKKPQSLKDYWQLNKTFKNRSFDILLAAQASFRANLIYPLIKATRKIGFDPIHSKDGHQFFIKETIAPADHLLDRFLNFAKALDINVTAPKWDLNLPESDLSWAQKNTPAGDFIAINLATSKPERNWPLKNLSQLLIQITQHFELPVVLIGGRSPQEQKLSAALMNSIKVERNNYFENIISLVGKTSLLQMAAVIQNATVLISPDSGPIHIATAVGTAVVGLYAIISTKISGPYFSQHFCIDKYDLAVKTFMKKTSKPISILQRVHAPRAMELISVEEVLSALKRVLETR